LPTFGHQRPAKLSTSAASKAFYISCQQSFLHQLPAKLSTSAAGKAFHISRRQSFPHWLLWYYAVDEDVM
jgi:hypothetical protein